MLLADLSLQSNIDEKKSTSCNMRAVGNIVLIHFAPEKQSRVNRYHYARFSQLKIVLKKRNPSAFFNNATKEASLMLRGGYPTSMGKRKPLYPSEKSRIAYIGH